MLTRRPGRRLRNLGRSDGSTDNHQPTRPPNPQTRPRGGFFASGPWHARHMPHALRSVRADEGFPARIWGRRGPRGRESGFRCGAGIDGNAIFRAVVPREVMRWCDGIPALSRGDCGPFWRFPRIILIPVHPPRRPATPAPRLSIPQPQPAQKTPCQARAGRIVGFFQPPAPIFCGKLQELAVFRSRS